MTTKSCIYCNEEKPLSEFHRKKDNPDGRDNRCKLCCNAMQRERNHHASRRAKPGDKKFFGRKVCNICGKPCNGMALCAAHKPKSGSCYHCPHREKCRARVHLGIYVLCERPNLGDMRYQEIVQKERMVEVYA